MGFVLIWNFNHDLHLVLLWWLLLVFLKCSLSLIPFLASIFLLSKNRSLLNVAWQRAAVALTTRSNLLTIRQSLWKEETSNCLYKWLWNLVFTQIPSPNPGQITYSKMTKSSLNLSSACPSQRPIEIPFNVVEAGEAGIDGRAGKVLVYGLEKGSICQSKQWRFIQPCW